MADQDKEDRLTISSINLGFDCTNTVECRSRALKPALPVIISIVVGFSSNRLTCKSMI